MKIGMLMRTLWTRHWWEVCLFVLVSFSLSSLVWSRTGSDFLQGLVWLEVGSAVWLVVRVSLTQPSFGTFGGWKTRTTRRGWYLLSEGLFLAVPLLLGGGLRLVVAGEVLQPNVEGWRELLKVSGVLVACLVGLFTIVKLVSFGWEMNDDSRRRRMFGWGMIVVLVSFSIVSVKGWGKSRYGRSGGSAGFMMSPMSLEGVEDWQWLRGDWSFAEIDDVELGKMELKKGEASEVDGLRAEILSVEVKRESIVVTWRGSRVKGFDEKIPIQTGVMLSYAGRYFGGSDVTRIKENRIRLPLLNLQEVEYSTEFLSPLALPENELGAEELIAGAELWLTFEELVIGRGTSRGSREVPENEEERLRWGLAGYNDEDGVQKMREGLGIRGREALDDVLAAAPWSGPGWEKIVLPYLVRFSGEEDLARLLPLLEKFPWMADLFFQKGWASEAEPLIREHLRKGKTLASDSVIYLAGLGEGQMGEGLENQLLRMRGDFDAVAAAVKGHPGVDWDTVRAEAWQRVVTGFGNHHVWVKWGAEMGEKEALRRLLVKAADGKKWERGILERWFGKDGNVVERLRVNWDEVVFEEGEWVFSD